MLNILRFRIVIILLIFCILGWFLFTYRILDVPPGINGDEAVIGYNAALVASSGYDANGKFLPLFTSMSDSYDWKQPVTFYSEVLAFRILGPSYFTLRAVSVFFVLISGFVIFLLVRELFGLKSAVWSLVIFATTPIIMIQSHLALENIAPVPFIAFWLWMLVKYSREPKTKFLILSSVSLGFSVYSYLGLRLIMPILALLTISFIYFLNKKISVKIINRICFFSLALIPFLIIFFVAKNQYPGSLLGQYRSYQITSYQQLLLPYISSFDPSFLFIKGDVAPYHSTGKHGVFLLASLPLFAFGIAKILQKRQPVLIFIAISFFLIPVLFGLGSDIHRGSRLLSLIPPYIVISALGIISLLNIRKKIWRYLSVFIIFSLIIFNFADFLNDYWYEYPKRIKNNFSKPLHKALEKSKVLSQKNNLTVFIQNDLYLENPLAVDFFEQVYFPNKLLKWGLGPDVPDSSIIIVNPADVENRLTDLEIENIEGNDLVLVINKGGLK